MRKPGKQARERNRRVAAPRFRRLRPSASGGTATDAVVRGSPSPEADELAPPLAGAAPRAFPQIEAAPIIDGDVEHVHDAGTPEQMAHAREAVSMQKEPDDG